MDAIEGLDDGTYSHFTYQAANNPELLQFFEPAFYLGSYVVALALLVIVVALLALRKEWRSVLIAILSFAAAICIIHLVQTWVPRARPQEGTVWLNKFGLAIEDGRVDLRPSFRFIFLVGIDERFGSYPSAGVFLFMLGMILLGKALWGRLSQVGRAAYTVIAALLVVWICMSAFYLATNFLTDVIGGLAGAGLVGWLAVRIMATRTQGADSV